jgi:hypothetical protein
VDDIYEHTVRPTMDVGVVVKALTRLDYSALEERLRGLGFNHDTRVGAPRCRWLFESITVDVMPTSPSVNKKLEEEYEICSHAKQRAERRE